MNFASVCCDWMSFRHEYAEPVPARESGRILKLSQDGEIEWEMQQWDQIKCASSDTSIRVKCDGRTLKGMANIGRFQQPDNRQGLTVGDCADRWREVLFDLGFDVRGFGTTLRRVAVGQAGDTLAKDSKLMEAGTYLTRLDLAGNFEVSDYAALCSASMVRRIGQKLPLAGLYGPTWGYQTGKRSNWWKAKLYDKQAELDGKRRGSGGATLARFEVQLGAEWLKREGFQRVDVWRDEGMANVVYGRFAEPVFRESLSVMDWAAIPSRLRQYAVLWRDGTDVRGEFKSASGYYKARAKLMEYGIDIGTPCNVMALTRHVRVVEVLPVSALRAA